MTETDGITKFLEYLDLLKDNIHSFEVITDATSIISAMPLEE